MGKFLIKGGKYIYIIGEKKVTCSMLHDILYHN